MINYRYVRMVRRFPTPAAYTSRDWPLLAGNPLCTRGEDGVVWAPGWSRKRNQRRKGIARGLAGVGRSRRPDARSCTSQSRISYFSREYSGIAAADQDLLARGDPAKPSILLCHLHFASDFLPPTSGFLANTPFCLHCVSVLPENIASSFRAVTASGLLLLRARVVSDNRSFCTKRKQILVSDGLACDVGVEGSLARLPRRCRFRR